MIADEQLRLEQRKKWDSVAANVPDFFRAHSTQYYRRCEIALLQRYFGNLQGKKVLKLDLWNEAINTRILHWVREQGAEAFGIDVSRVVAARARKNAKLAPGELHLAQCDIRELPFLSGSFDFVYTMGTIEHINEYQQAVGEIYRVLRPGGKAIVGVPHKWNVFLRPLLVALLDHFGKYAYSPELSFSARELREMVIRSGLIVRQRTGILSIPGVVRMADLYCYSRGIPLHRLSPLFIWPFDFVETRWAWPAYLGYLIAMVAEKAR